MSAFFGTKAPKTAPNRTPAKKLPKAGSKSKPKKRRGGQPSFAPTVYRLLKSVTPDTGISNQAMAVVLSYIEDMFDRIYKAARIFSVLGARKTISSREIQGAVRLLMPGDLAKHCVMKGVISVTKYNASLGNGRGTKASRAELIFSPTRVERMLRRKLPGWKIGTTASVYAAAVLQFLTTELLELAFNVTKEFKMIRINPRQLQIAIRTDEQLALLVGHKTIVPAGGVIPYIHPAFFKTAPRVEADQ
jgi:histone H2B